MYHRTGYCINRHASAYIDDRGDDEDDEDEMEERLEKSTF
jgi:hypothetical protein